MKPQDYGDLTHISEGEHQSIFLRTEAQPQSLHHPGILNGGKPSHHVDIVDAWIEQPLIHNIHM